MKITVCKDCQERYPACHGSCAKYLEERKKFDEQKQARIKIRRAEKAAFNTLFRYKAYRNSVDKQLERWHK